jgi:hypothetical protein
MKAITKTAPAFQLYASDTMADRRFRTMSLAERGLFISFLCECWVNRSIPADAQSIAKLLGFGLDEIAASLSEKVLSFFVKNDEGELVNPELERYREKLDEAREKMSKGGKRGAEKRWDKPSADDNHPINLLDRVSMGSRVEKSRNETSRREKSRREEKQHYVKDNEEVLTDNHTQWVADYDAQATSSDDPIPF